MGDQPHRISLPTGLAVGDVNAYLFTEPEPVLVDTGVNSEENWATLTKGLHEHGLEIKDLSRVVITHAHVDHFGSARRITENSSAEVWIVDLGYPWIVDFNNWWDGRQNFYRDDFLPKAGIPADLVEIIVSYFYEITSLAASVPRSRVKVFKAGDSLPMGRRSWEVIHTPGHASMQTCFYQPETRQFISADMLLPRAPTPIVEKPPDGQKRVPALPQFLTSLELVEALDIDQVYPGHGEPFKEHRTLIQTQRKRIEARKNECFSHVASGCRTPFEILEKMYAHYPLQLRLPGLWMLIGYLDLLVAEGRVEASLEDGVWRYKVNQT